VSHCRHYLASSSATTAAAAAAAMVVVHTKCGNLCYSFLSRRQFNNSDYGEDIFHIPCFGLVIGFSRNFRWRRSPVWEKPWGALYVSRPLISDHTDHTAVPEGNKRDACFTLMTPDGTNVAPSATCSVPVVVTLGLNVMDGQCKMLSLWGPSCCVTYIYCINI
jgi:hypothetical protein